jgi:mannose-6-phosphate isomerase
LIAYPILLEPLYDPKIWGGRRLETVLGKTLPETGPVGESLESGDDAVVANGPLSGANLGQLVAQHGAELLGSRGVAASRPFGDFPLLVKFIDASGVLSLQVHPDDDGARELGKRGKTEAWYIVDAEPGSSLITGMSRPASAPEVRGSIGDGTFEDLLERCIVTGGESLLVPAGTMHAIGEGVLLYEVQQNSDLTFRLYDWGRVDERGNPRQLHLDQALDALRPECHAVAIEPQALDDWRDVVGACRYFMLERWRVDGARPLPGTGGTTFRLLSCISGCAGIEMGEMPRVDITLGQTILLPADLQDVVIDGAATLLCSSVPDLEQDVVRPLRARGQSDEEIARLAGDTNDLASVLAHGN